MTGRAMQLTSERTRSTLTFDASRGGTDTTRQLTRTDRRNVYPSLRSHLTPSAEDPRCARMTTYSIPLCTRTTAGKQKNKWTC
jgi:hypothetical protein